MSAGISPVPLWNEAETRNREYVLEDPKYRVESPVMSGGHGSREAAKQLEDEKQKRQQKRLLEGVSEKPNRSHRNWGLGHSFLNSLRSFGRSDLGTGRTVRRNADDKVMGGSSVDTEVESDYVGRGDRQRDLEKGNVYRTEVVHGSKSVSASASLR